MLFPDECVPIYNRWKQQGRSLDPPIRLLITIIGLSCNYTRYPSRGNSDQITLKGFLKHLENIESKIFYFSDIFSSDDFDRMSEVLRFLKRFLRFILKNATIHKRPLLKTLKGTYV